MPTHAIMATRNLQVIGRGRLCVRQAITGRKQGIHGLLSSRQSKGPDSVNADQVIVRRLRDRATPFSDAGIVVSQQPVREQVPAEALSKTA